MNIEIHKYKAKLSYNKNSFFHKASCHLSSLIADLKKIKTLKMYKNTQKEKRVCLHFFFI